MAGKAVISLSTRLEDPENVTMAFLVAKQLDQGGLLPNAELAGSLQLWEWIGDEGATTFSY
jgi:hypothetical protein